MNDWIDHIWCFWGMGWGMLFWLIIGISYLFYAITVPNTYRRRRKIQ